MSTKAATDIRASVSNLTAAADRFLENEQNPRHRAIIENYRRHALLEVSGLWEEIFDPSMSVEHPVYTVTDQGNYYLLDGPDAVHGFYQEIIAADMCVMWMDHEILSVADWGFASESYYHQLVPGASLQASGVEVDDPSGVYDVSHSLAMIWHYDDRARMIGEHIYNAEDRAITLIDPANVVTAAEARALLAPQIRPLPALVF